MRRYTVNRQKPIADITVRAQQFRQGSSLLLSGDDQANLRQVRRDIRELKKASGRHPTDAQSREFDRLASELQQIIGRMKPLP